MLADAFDALDRGRGPDPYSPDAPWFCMWQTATTEPCWTAESQGRKGPECRVDGQAVSDSDVCLCPDRACHRQLQCRVQVCCPERLVAIIPSSCTCGHWRGEGLVQLKRQRISCDLSRRWWWKHRHTEITHDNKVFDGYQFVTLMCPPSLKGTHPAASIALTTSDRAWSAV